VIEFLMLFWKSAEMEPEAEARFGNMSQNHHDVIVKALQAVQTVASEHFLSVLRSEPDSKPEPHQNVIIFFLKILHYISQGKGVGAGTGNA
jgi:hypothetical protein